MNCVKTNSGRRNGITTALVAWTILLLGLGPLVLSCESDDNGDKEANAPDDDDDSTDDDLDDDDSDTIVLFPTTLSYLPSTTDIIYITAVQNNPDLSLSLL